jgi:hypothetical protein
MKMNTPQEHYGEREQREGVGRRAAETEWNHTTRTITGPGHVLTIRETRLRPIVRMRWTAPTP